MEDHQRQESAEPGERQRRENGQRMDEALVQDAEDHVDHGDGHEQQHAEALQRRLERLRRPLEGGGHARRQGDARGLLDFRDCVAERVARLEVERERHRRQLSGVVDHRRTDGRGKLRHRAERHELSGGGADVDHRQRLRVLLELGGELHDDLVSVVRRVDGRDLPRGVRGEERVLDLLRGQPQSAWGSSSAGRC